VRASDLKHKRKQRFKKWSELASQEREWLGVRADSFLSAGDHENTSFAPSNPARSVAYAATLRTIVKQHFWVN
jgi:hypothetical protein